MITIDRFDGAPADLKAMTKSSLRPIFAAALTTWTLARATTPTIAGAQVTPPTGPALEAPATDPDPSVAAPFVPPATAPSSPTPVSAVPPTSDAVVTSTTLSVPRAYRSEADDLLSIDKVSVLPFTDNLNGIYARPLEAHFAKLIETQHRWDVVPATSTGQALTPDELEGDPAKVIAAARDLHVDAIFAARVVKSGDGVNVHLSLFLAKDGKLLSQALLKDYRRFELADIKEQTTRLMNEVVSRLPYAGRVLSRDGLRITINLGSQDGLRKDQVLNVIQILQLQRHPRFNFLIKTEKEILGQVRVLKADETLSFAAVTMEKEAGAIQKGAKIATLENVTYATTDLAGGGEGVAEAQPTNGATPGEWAPAPPPSIGSVGVRFGVGRFTGATALTGVGGLQASDNSSVSVGLDGEIWITPEWTVSARIRQGLAQINNPRDDSAPRKLSASLSLYDVNFGYTLRFGTLATSPSVEPYLGYFLQQFYVDDSTPLAFTTSRYQGLKVGLRGQAPLGDTGEYGVGGDFAIALMPGLGEDPISSGGSPRNTVIQFGVLGYKKLGERLRLTASVDFEMFATNFSGEGGRGAQSATSSSQRYTTVSAGVGYMF